MIEFITSHWAELLFAFMALLKVIVNLTPTEKDNQIFGWLDTIINVIIGNRIKKQPAPPPSEYVPKKKKRK